MTKSATLPLQIVVLFPLLLLLSTMVRVLDAQSPANTLTQTITDTEEGKTFTLRMTKESLRGPNFNVKVQNALGLYDDHTPGEVRTYVGTVDERPDAVAVGYLQTDGQFWSRIYLDRGERWTALGDTITSTSAETPTYRWPTSPTVTARQGGTTVYQYEMGIDVDYDAYDQTFGPEIADTLEMVEKNLSAWKAIQLRDNMMLPALGCVIVRASEEDDPYRNCRPLLECLENEWNNNQADARSYCFKTTLVSPNINGGVAWVSGSDNVSGFTSDGLFMQVGRHELGHNFGALDYEADSPEGNTIMCGNQISRFNGPSVHKHLNHRNDNIDSKLYPIGAYTTVNIPPYAALDLYDGAALPGQYINIDHALANDFDANAHSLSVLSCQAMSNLGGTVEVSPTPTHSDRIVYTAPASTGGGMDWFHYTVKDESGKTATGAVFLNVSLPAGTLVWDGAGANWRDGAPDDTHWDGGEPGDYPVAGVKVIVNLGTCTVDGTEEALWLAMGGGSVSVDGSLTVAGGVTVAAGATLNVEGTLTAASVNAGDESTAGGTVSGSGVINTALASNGLVSPGGSGAAGTLTVNGEAELFDSAAYLCEVDALSNDKIHLGADSDLWLAGNLDVKAIGVKAEEVASHIKRTIIDTGTGGSIAGTFSEPATSGADSHLGNGVFYRGSTTTATEMEIELLVARGGDGNVDGKVDTLDITNLVANFALANRTWTDNDTAGGAAGRGDTVVDTLDITDLVANFDPPPGPDPGPCALGGTTAVPEPGTVAMLVAGVLVLLLLCRRRHVDSLG